MFSCNVCSGSALQGHRPENRQVLVRYTHDSGARFLIADYYPTAPCRLLWEAPGRTETVVLEFDSLVSSTSDFYVITSVHMKRLNDGRLVDMGCLMMLCSFKNQVQVQLYLFSNFDINTLDHTKMNIALVGNARHFRNKIDLPGSEGLEGVNITLQKMVSSSPFAS